MNAFLGDSITYGESVAPRQTFVHLVEESLTQRCPNGVVTINLGNPAEAIEFTRKAMSLNPHYTWEFPYNLGRAHWAHGDYDAAVPLLEEALKISDIIRLEIHGPEAELAKMREPLADLSPQFFELEYGFRR